MHYKVKFPYIKSKFRPERKPAGTVGEEPDKDVRNGSDAKHKQYRQYRTVITYRQHADDVREVLFNDRYFSIDEMVSCCERHNKTDPIFHRGIFSSTTDEAEVACLTGLETLLEDALNLAGNVPEKNLVLFELMARRRLDGDVETYHQRIAELLNERKALDTKRTAEKAEALAEYELAIHRAQIIYQQKMHTIDTDKYRQPIQRVMQDVAFYRQAICFLTVCSSSGDSKAKYGESERSVPLRDL